MEEVQPIRVKQPSISAPGTHLTPNPGQQSSAIEVPFQLFVSDLGVIEVHAQTTLSSDPTLAQLTSIYRHAQIVECAAILMPSSAASKNPVHCDICWVPSNSSASPKTILSTFGGTRYTIGGPITSNQIITLPLNLNSVNPIIKDSVLYLDSPRLLAFSPAPVSVQSVPSATLIIRGKVRLSSVLIQPLSSSS